MYEYSLIASSFRVLRLLSFIPNVRLILWTVIKSLEVSVLSLLIFTSHAHNGYYGGRLNPLLYDCNFEKTAVYHEHILSKKSLLRHY